MKNIEPEHQNQSGLLTTLLCSVINAFFYTTPTGEDKAICVNCHHQFVFNEDLFLRIYFYIIMLGLKPKPKPLVWTYYVPMYQCAVS